jgi:hypothetical protein
MKQSWKAMNLQHKHVSTLLLGLLLATGASRSGAFADQRSVPIVIPFELATRHILVKVTVNHSRPLTFILDTGAGSAVMRLDVAKELGLRLEGNVNIGGAGEGSQSGKLIRGASWSLVGLDGFSQPVTMALPFTEAQAAMGRDVDGIIGGEFIRQFVVELDYQGGKMTLHRPASFEYKGDGQAIPLRFDVNRYPVLTATVTAPGRPPIDRLFLFDIGSSGALILHSPFVVEQDLLSTQTRTIQSIGGAGAGGRTSGDFGRVTSLQIGRFVFENPITMFSRDKAGAFANPNLAGNIGAQIAVRFHLYLDYGRKQMIVEPSSRFADPFDRAFSGLAIRTTPPEYTTFKIIDVLRDSPASEAGMRPGDVITAIDGRPAKDLTMTTLNEMLEKAVTYVITLRRGDQEVEVSLTPKRMVAPIPVP